VTVFNFDFVVLFKFTKTSICDFYSEMKKYQSFGL
jgi:hypothetical protein